MRRAQVEYDKSKLSILSTIIRGLMVISLAFHTADPGLIPARTSFKFQIFLIIEDRLIEDRLSDTKRKSV